jgi:Protein of unknown function (DUF2026)
MRSNTSDLHDTFKRTRMKFDITLKQYETIYRIVASVGEHFSHGAGRSCQFYNVNGAFLLCEILKINAKPIMGAAFIKVSDQGGIIAFASEEESKSYSSSPEAFHCWVETKNNYIDFTAPEYREAARGMDDSSSIPRKMFQKPKALMATDPYSLVNPGDYYFCENKVLTNYLLSKMMSKPAMQDFANICCDWYCEYKKKKNSSMTVMNDLGELTPINMKSSKLQRKW